MPARFSSAVLSFVALAAPALAGTRIAPDRTRALSPVESGRLQAISDPGLGDLRAGSVASPATLQAGERAGLAAAAARDAGLGDLRAGNLTLSDHDIQLIVIVAVVVIILILI